MHSNLFPFNFNVVELSSFWIKCSRTFFLLRKTNCTIPYLLLLQKIQIELLKYKIIFEKYAIIGLLVSREPHRQPVLPALLQIKQPSSWIVQHCSDTVLILNKIINRYDLVFTFSAKDPLTTFRFSKIFYRCCSFGYKFNSDSSLAPIFTIRQKHGKYRGYTVIQNCGKYRKWEFTLDWPVRKAGQCRHLTVLQDGLFRVIIAFRNGLCPFLAVLPSCSARRARRLR